jgi:hypothetical protein
VRESPESVAGFVGIRTETPGITRDAPLTAGKPKVAYSQLAAAFRLTGAAFTSRYRQRLVSHRPNTNPLKD